MSKETSLSLFGSTLFVAASAVAAATTGVGTWDPTLFVVLLLVVVGADLLPMTGPTKVQISGSFLGLLLAMALLGPTAAAAIGAAATILDGVRDLAYRRASLSRLTVNLGAFTAFPVAGGLVMAGLAGTMDVMPGHPGYIVPMAAGFAVATLLNFAVVIGAQVISYGISPLEQLRAVFLPLVPSELAMLLLASVIVYAETHVGPVALVTLVGLLFVYLWLYRELLTSQKRAEELDSRTHQLATLQVGVLTAMLRTLALRDHMTARHSAAVARYARELARAAGCSDAEIELAHTAGLLHDIGKFIFPDHILLADSRLTEEDWEIVKRHPFQGAKIVREVEGYGPVADIILGHHERIDGKGYPRGMCGDQIPLLSRVISICDTYDVLTARDSYREPISTEAAIAELRAASGKQLDAELVEIFIGLVRRGELDFRHGDDADFESELQFEERVRDYAAPNPQSPTVPAAA